MLHVYGSAVFLYGHWTKAYTMGYVFRYVYIIINRVYCSYATQASEKWEISKICISNNKKKNEFKIGGDDDIGTEEKPLIKNE